jgi:ATP-binding cassette, subfamily C, bacterial PrsD
MAGLNPGDNPASSALWSTRRAFVHVAVFSAFINILMLNGSLYMLQIYDRVLASRSIPTLVALSVITLAAFVLQGVLDASRGKMMSRIGAEVDRKLAPFIARAVVTYPLKGANPADSAQPLRDLDTLRTFLSGAGPTALIDMPFMPLFIAACFILHPWLGWLAVGGAVLIVAMTYWTDRASRQPSLQVMKSGAERATLVEAGRRNAEAIAAMGMFGAFAHRFNAVHDRQVADGLILSDTASGIGSAAKVPCLRWARSSSSGAS